MAEQKVQCIAHIMFKDGSAMNVPVAFQDKDAAEKAMLEYSNYMGSKLAHDDPFYLNFGSLIIRGSEIRAFEYNYATEDSAKVKHRIDIGFASQKG
ncbi:MAG: hypothetical protein KA965_01295 [Butyrivibrio sp.]|nr:hypothetical protein [Butyrivibrio sp.]